jgi:hypothetical protein
MASIFQTPINVKLIIIIAASSAEEAWLNDAKIYHNSELYLECQFWYKN